MEEQNEIREEKTKTSQKRRRNGFNERRLTMKATLHRKKEKQFASPAHFTGYIAQKNTKVLCWIDIILINFLGVLPILLFNCFNS